MKLFALFACIAGASAQLMQGGFQGGYQQGAFKGGLKGGYQQGAIVAGGLKGISPCL